MGFEKTGTERMVKKNIAEQKMSFFMHIDMWLEEKDWNTQKQRRGRPTTCIVVHEQGAVWLL